MRPILTAIVAAASFTPLAASAAPRAGDPVVVPPQLSDPAMADRMVNVLQSLTGAFLNLPVGEVQAAIEGRPATPADRAETVGSIERRKDPDFDRHLRQQIAGSGETMRAGMRAMSTALPAVMKGMAEAREGVERAIANMPSPVYPNR